MLGQLNDNSSAHLSTFPIGLPEMKTEGRRRKYVSRGVVSCPEQRTYPARRLGNDVPKGIREASKKPKSRTLGDRSVLCAGEGTEEKITLVAGISYLWRVRRLERSRENMNQVRVFLCRMRCLFMGCTDYSISHIVEYFRPKV